MNYGMLGRAILKCILWAIGGTAVLIGGMFAVDSLKSIQSPWFGYTIAILTLTVVFVGSVWGSYKTMVKKAGK